MPEKWNYLLNFTQGVNKQYLLSMLSLPMQGRIYDSTYEGVPILQGVSNIRFSQMLQNTA